MKLYLPLIAALILFPVTAIPVLVVAETQVIAAEIEPELRQYARSISVKIDSNNSGGSGVIIGKQGDKYLVITNKHVVRGGDNFKIGTVDGMIHQGRIVSNPITSDDDIALLSFNSKDNYQLVRINSTNTGIEKKQIYAVGYVAETGQFTVEAGTIQQILQQPFQEGYQIGYTNNIVAGMSGGAIFDELGDLVGINGISAYPILDTVYRYEDNTTPPPAEIEKFRALSWGLSVYRLLIQLNPEIITAYNLPLPETVNEVNTQLTGWLGELETKAKQITVRIDTNSGANGSGVIIAKEGNTYAVLTADHVICEKDTETRECLDYTYEILAPDGQKYPVDSSSITRQEGVDLAVVKFTSNENYQVAQLANYPVTDNDAVFVAGYPRLDRNKPAPWLFSLGYGLERERGLLNVNDNSLSTDSSGLTQSQGSLSGGYEMVYTSITYGGMSGGAVLDRDGRVIGIHGLAEGETALDSQSSSQKQIQLGYSLGIPINTFIGLTDRLKINSALPIQKNKPRELNSVETEAWQAAILGTEIPQGNATAERWIERGNQLWRLRRYEEAVKAFDKAIVVNPEFIHLAYYGKGLALWYRDENEAALENLELATETEPNFAPAFFYKSSVLRDLNRLEEALIAIDKAIDIEKNSQQENANLYSEKGVILSNLKRYGEAEVAYNQAIKRNPRSSFYNNRGLLYYEEGKPDLAVADYNKAIALNPNLAQAYNNRGLLYYEEGKPELALADWNKAIDLNPNFAGAYNNRGLLYYEEGSSDLALADWNKAIDLNPNFAGAYNNRGLLYYEEGSSDLALADYNKAIDLNPNLAQAYTNRGLLYYHQGSPELALTDYNKAIDLNPNLAQAYTNRGLLYDDQGSPELALTDYNKAISLNPNFALAYYNRGIVYQRQGKLDLALADYNKAIDLNPNLAQAYNNRGALYKDQGKPELALADYNKAIDLNPNEAKAYYNRGILYYSQGSPELALADYNKAIDLNPNEAKAYYNRGIVYQRQGKLDLALADYNQTLLLDKKYWSATNNIGLIKYEMSLISEARQKFEQAINIDNSSAEPQLALAVTLFTLGESEKALVMAEKALSIDKQFANPEFLKKNLWGDKLIADTKKLLSHPQIQALLSRL
jgi:tetratricopeptide (TPR) repeat protein/S1-C subfamily serine protease